MNLVLQTDYYMGLNHWSRVLEYNIYIYIYIYVYIYIYIYIYNYNTLTF